MTFFPNIALLNRYYLGDSVLLEPIACMIAESLGTEVSIASNYSELFLGHPSVRGIALDRDVPRDMRFIDMSDAIKSLETLPNGKQLVIEGKLRRMYDAAGLSVASFLPPRLYLTDTEIAQANELGSILPENRIGIALESRHSFKNISYIEFLAKKLVRDGYSVFLFGKDLNNDYDSLKKTPTIKVFDRPIRDAMVYLSLMDSFVGPDTGLVHIAGALQVPFVVVTRDIWRDLYESYDVGEILSTKHFGKKSMSTMSVTPRRVMRSVKSRDVKPVKVRKKERSRIALFRLDGLGGTVTLTDQAKKIYEQTGEKSTVIVRGYGDLFKDNPHVADVVEVGHVKWGECMSDMLKSYETIGEVRFAPAKWHQQGKKFFEQDFTQEQGIFDAFPRNYNDLEIHGLHHVQLTDKYLGLPYDTIDMGLYADQHFRGDLPAEFIAIANGVDVQHQGMNQTKTWDQWNSLKDHLNLPMVQVGTAHDRYIPGVIDLRGQTSLLELCYVLKKATALVCTEGGMMHLAYALGCSNVFVLRGPTRGKLFEYPGHRFVDSYVCDICWSTTDDWYANCPKGIDAVCMKTISAERVAMSVMEAVA